MTNSSHRKNCFNWKFLKANRGITLAELMISIVIFVMITAGAYTVAVTSQGHWDANRVRIQLHQELRKATEAMVNDIRQAGPGSIQNVLANGSAYTTIILKRGNAVTSGVLVWDADAIQYSRGGTDSSQLIRTQGGNSRVMANNISNLTFRRQSASPDIVEVTIQGQDTTDSGRTATYQLSLTVELRN